MTSGRPNVWPFVWLDPSATACRAATVLVKKGTRLDLRRTIRVNLAQGGEPINLIQQKKPNRPVRIVVFLDVSGSMQPYSRFFLQFVKGLVCSWLETDAYLFHTRLLRVTDAVRDRDSIRAMSSLALMAEGFGGGTRLGACLKIFNDRYAKSTLDNRTLFLVPLRRLRHRILRGSR